MTNIVPLRSPIEVVRTEFESHARTLPGFQEVFFTRRIEEPEEYALKTVQASWVGWLSAWDYYKSEGECNHVEQP